MAEEKNQMLGGVTAEDPDTLTEVGDSDFEKELMWVQECICIIHRTYGTSPCEAKIKSFLIECLDSVQPGVSDPLVRLAFDRFLWSAISTFSIFTHVELWSRIQVGKEDALAAQDESVRPEIERAQRMDQLEVEARAGDGK
jgi:hypothetical protein